MKMVFGTLFSVRQCMGPQNQAVTQKGNNEGNTLKSLVCHLCTSCSGSIGTKEFIFVLYPNYLLSHLVVNCISLN